MRITSHFLIASLVGLAGVAFAGLHWVLVTGYLAMLALFGSAGAPSYVHAGVPFLVRDSYGTQICISTRSGRPYLPFVAPRGPLSPAVFYAGTPANAYAGTSANVRAGIPFVVRDGLGSQFCISSRGGEPLPPFILP